MKLQGRVVLARIAVAFITIVLVLSAFPGVLKADTEDTVPIVLDRYKLGLTEESDKEVIKWDSDKNGLSFSFSGKDMAPTSREQRIVTGFFSELSANPDISTKALNEAYKALQSTNNNAYVDITLLLSGMNTDVPGGMAVMAPLQGPISLLLGMAAFVLVALVALTTGADIIYISNPGIWNGGQKSDQQPRFVSAEARKAVSKSLDFSRSQSDDGYVSPWWIYLQKRGITYVLVGIVVFLLVTGQINLITIWVIRLVSGFLGWIGAL